MPRRDEEDAEARALGGGSQCPCRTRRTPRETCLRSPRTSGCRGLDDLLGERQVVLALEVLADLRDVLLRAVLRVAAVKDLQEPLCLLVDLPLRGARRPCLGRVPVRRLPGNF